MVALKNPALRRLRLAYSLSFSVEFAIWLALLIFG